MQMLIFFRRMSAVNEAPDSATLDLDAAANAAMVEGRAVIPYGLWPVKARGRDGKLTNVLQRFDKAVADRLVAAFGGLRGRLARLVAPCSVYRGHPDWERSSRRADWSQLGTCIALEAGNAAMTIQCELTDEAKALVAANGVGPSPYWALRPTGEVKDGTPICEPIALYSLGLVSRPNIPGSAVNSADGDEAAELSAQAERDRQLAVLAAEIADLEGKLATALAAVDARAAELLQKDAGFQELATQVKDLRSKLDAASIASDAMKQKAETDMMACNARVDAVLGAIVDAAIAAGRLVAADREHWIGRLRQTPEAANELYVATLKDAGDVTQARLLAANAALGGASAAQQFERLVRERMARTSESWPDAWNACKADHQDIYRLMPNGGKA